MRFPGQRARVPMLCLPARSLTRPRPFPDRNGDISGHTLFLWRNEPTVVIGRCQNPWKECNVQAMQAKGVHLARRSSGGGAVYQDLGNTNFTFLSSTENFDKIRNSGIIIDALSKWGLRATTSGRNDIVVGPDDAPLKISGAAYKLSPPRALHHGTLLIDVDMGALSALLNPNKLKLQSKGVASVAARVTNLKKLDAGITHETLSEAVIAAFCNHYSSGPVTPQALDHSYLQQRDDLRVRGVSLPGGVAIGTGVGRWREVRADWLHNLSCSLARARTRSPCVYAALFAAYGWVGQSKYEEIKDEKWRFGETPEFSHHLEGRFESPSPWVSTRRSILKFSSV